MLITATAPGLPAEQAGMILSESRIFRITEFHGFTSDLWCAFAKRTIYNFKNYVRNCNPEPTITNALLFPTYAKNHCFSMNELPALPGSSLR